MMGIFKSSNVPTKEETSINAVIIAVFNLHLKWRQIIARDVSKFYNALKKMRGGISLNKFIYKK